MVDDNQIEAKESPFAMRKGEIKVFDGKDGYVSMNQIINKINIGHITDLHFEILNIVNELEFVTSRQLCQLLDHKGIEYKSQDKLNWLNSFLWFIPSWVTYPLLTISLLNTDNKIE